MLAFQFWDEGARHGPRQRHVARRADDRLRLRGVPLDRSARSAHAAVDLSSTCEDGPTILVDTSTDLRRRRSTHDVTRVDAILFTHSHADHVMGLDEVRRFNACRRRAIPAMPTSARGDAAAHVRLRLRSADARRAAACRSSRCTTIAGPFYARRRRDRAGAALARRAADPRLPLRRFAYLTDCSAFPTQSWPLLDGVETLVLDALRHRPHPTHFTVAEALDGGRAHRSRAQTYFTHICHDLPHAATCAALPAGVELAYDGLAFDDRALDAAARRHGRHSLSRTTRARRAGDRRCWRSATSTACTAATQDHRARAARRRRARRHGVVLTFDPHPPRVVRPDKAPPLLMTMAQKLEALARAGVQGAAIVRFTPRAVALGAGDLRAQRAGRLAARRRSVGRRRLSVRPRSHRQLLAAARARRALRLQGREDRSGPLQGLRRVQHAHPPAGQRRPRRRGRRAARPPLLRSTARSSRREARPRARLSDRQPLDRQRAAAAARRLCDRRHHRRQRASVRDQHRAAADLRRSAGRRRSRRTCFDFDRDLYGRTGPRSAFVQRLRDERGFRRSTRSRRRSPPMFAARRVFDRLSVCRIRVDDARQGRSRSRST